MERGVVWLGISNWRYFDAYRGFPGAIAPPCTEGGWLHDAEIPCAISADNLGGYMIVDMSRNTVAAGGRFELTLEDVREWGTGICADRGCG